MSQPPWLEFLYEALGSQCGVVVAVSDINNAKQSLYRARAQAQDPDLQRLQLRTSPTAPMAEIWIVKSGEKISDPT